MLDQHLLPLLLLPPRHLRAGLLLLDPLFHLQQQLDDVAAPVAHTASAAHATPATPAGTDILLMLLMLLMLNI